MEPFPSLSEAARTMIPLRSGRAILCILLATMVAVAWKEIASSCPFCAAVSQTMDEELQSMQVAVFATLEHAADIHDDVGGDAELPMSRFRVSEIIKGQPDLKVGDEIKVAYFGPPDKSYTFLIMSPEEKTLMWGNPLLLTDTGANYVRKLRELAPDHSRLIFFLDYLEHEDELLSRDSYDEFANASYEDVIAIKEHMDREQLIQWLHDDDVSVEHRRLYMTMLGVCGRPEDADLLETMMRSSDPAKRSGLNALVGAYLTLKGAAGLPVINELFLANEDVGYADVHAAIMAIRFHGNESDVIPREELIQSLHVILGRKEIADLVIPDLARWEDWSVLPKVVELFKTADPASNWVRVPVVNYVRACPLPAAQEAMAQLEAIDAESVRRASALFPFAAGGTPKEDPAESASPSEEAEPEQAIAEFDSPYQRPDPFANQRPIALDGASKGSTPSRSPPGAGTIAFGSRIWGIWLVSCIALLFGALAVRRATTKAH